MTSHFDESKITHYLLDELSQEEGLVVETLCASDPAARTFLKEQREVLRLLKGALERPHATSKRPSPRRPLAQIAIGLAAAIALVMGFSFATHEVLEPTPKLIAVQTEPVGSLFSEVDVSHSLSKVVQAAPQGKRHPRHITVTADDSHATVSYMSLKDYVMHVVHDHMDDLQACPGRLLVGGGLGNSQRITLEWTIDDQGKLLHESAIVVPRSAQSDEIAQCFLSKLRTWPFPPLTAQKSLTVTYPFVLSAGE